MANNFSRRASEGRHHPSRCENQRIRAKTALIISFVIYSPRLSRRRTDKKGSRKAWGDFRCFDPTSPFECSRLKVEIIHNDRPDRPVCYDVAALIHKYNDNRNLTMIAVVQHTWPPYLRARSLSRPPRLKSAVHLCPRRVIALIIF